MAWRSERVSRRCAAFVLLTGVVAAPASAQSLGDLRNMSIDQLAQIEVRSASKREEPLSSAPAALYVITSDDILNSGATTLPEVLRLAPNLNVQQVDASQYSISARGFNGVQAGNKVLALIDGRTIYTPLGSSVLWNLHYPMLEDLQQVEVISGPGGTLYGPNAVNGVINITTKDARDTIGTLVRGTAGSEEITAAIRHGFALGKSGAIRVYADYHNDDGLPAGIGAPIDDSYKGWQAGFRSDFEGEADHFTVQGDLFHTDANTLPADGAHGQNVLGRWTRTLSPTSSFQVQAYYDFFKRQFTDVLDSLQTVDAEGQLNTTIGRHDLVTGVGVRTTRDDFVNDLNQFNLNPQSRRLWTSNIFAQDRFHVSDQLAVIAGVKVERSTFTGWQVLPNLRLAWQPNQRNLVWTAVSRAVRTPSRIDRQLEAPPFLAPSPNFESEKLVAVEAGYRGQPSRTTSFSINGFVNFYDDLRSTEFVNGSFMLENGSQGHTYGIEAWGNAQLAPWWRVAFGVSTLWKHLHDKPGHTELIPRNSLGNDPPWQIIGRSDFDLAKRLHLNIRARAIGPIRQAPRVDSYVEASGELSWDATNRFQLFLAARNLIHKTHEESNDPTSAQLAKRMVYAGVRARL
ncbi:MAG TPA: TonB-dependent receptor [Sphingomicrobium sp.]|nr:TonB-dependent receptor [Sphingomicrobium sp.]